MTKPVASLDPDTVDGVVKRAEAEAHSLESRKRLFGLSKYGEERLQEVHWIIAAQARGLRTPGTVEVCALCGDGPPDPNCKGYEKYFEDIMAPPELRPCPVFPRPSQEAR